MINLGVALLGCVSIVDSGPTSVVCFLNSAESISLECVVKTPSFVAPSLAARIHLIKLIVFVMDVANDDDGGLRILIPLISNMIPRKSLNYAITPEMMTIRMTLPS